MDTVLLIASIMLLMVHSSDLVLNESLGTTYPSCLPDYRWSTKFGKCVECLPGFYGSDCSETCRYPNYGDGCQQKCHCSEKICHSAKGCRELGMDMDKIVSGFTSNILLGCGVILLAVLVLLKTSRYVLRCKSNYVYPNQPERRNTSRYDSLRFGLRSTTTPLDDLQGTTCGRGRVGTC